MSPGAAKLIIAIVVGGYVMTFLIAFREWYEERHSSQLRQGNNRIRREIDRHRSDDGG